ncbi:DUF1549 and DUF1553 domain-containing protein [Crateriforma conspicua]|uniref:DUF1549 and DUF1553 domain-containing protein n=1 Tax=Crateriforma conspicua TaxID=2527996 RepID=UPI0011890F05|nr:DUF1549 and DUF1553 domain-containing protein [Crateriforma conspicua]QDV64194.1 hypothetical protein Mal65_33450 [Crateriforma conspicua]
MSFLRAGGRAGSTDPQIAGFQIADLQTTKVPRVRRPRAGRRVNGLVCMLVCLLIAAGSAVPATAQQNRGKGKPAAKKPAPPKIRLPESVRRAPKSTMKVTGVGRSSRSEAQLMAAEIDRLIERALVQGGQLPNDMTDDSTFVRRVYLDVAGRIPTLQETQAFLDSDDPMKREDLIDQLLGSPDSVSHFYNVWADTLRIVDRPQPNIIGNPFSHYVKEAIRTNKPYDDWVYEMLTADGKSWTNPAVGYQLRDDGMALPYIDNTVRVFLGTQIGCAQCHDHPFADWTQYQFYELAAFTAGVRTRIQRGDPGFEKQNPAQKLINQAKNDFDKGRVPGYFQRLARANTYVVSEKPRKLRLPKDYAYTDAKPGEVVEPAVPWGEVPDSNQFKTPRQKFAAWLTSPENPQFSKMIANRLWRQFTGVGLVEPVDDFNDDNPPSNEAMMEYLATAMVDTGFDMKQWMRGVLYSKTYQRESAVYDPTSDEPFLYAGPAIRRMSAEQVWDSMLTLAVVNPMPFQRPSAKDYAEVVDIDFSKITYQQLKQQSETFRDTYFAAGYNRSLNQHAYKGNVLCRASELPSPAPSQHFLRQFGQGDRETINGAELSATVPQILAMFNGPITHVMLEAGSSIVDNVSSERTVRDRIDAVFLSVLSRRPSSIDRGVASSELKREQTRPHVAFGNIIWALLNTREFMFIH